MRYKPATLLRVRAKQAAFADFVQNGSGAIFGRLYGNDF
jgi:hypothetical protein